MFGWYQAAEKEDVKKPAGSGCLHLPVATVSPPPPPLSPPCPPPPGNWKCPCCCFKLLKNYHHGGVGDVGEVLLPGVREGGCEDTWSGVLPYPCPCWRRALFLFLFLVLDLFLDLVLGFLFSKGCCSSMAASFTLSPGSLEME